MKIFCLKLFVVLFLMFFVSCDYILKEKKDRQNTDMIVTDGGKTVIGEEDEFGCAYSAGYRWSVLKNDCIRIFEHGFRLNPITLESGSQEENELEDNDVSCFVIIGKNKKEAEIFLPNQQKSIVLEQKNMQGLYSNEGWELDTRQDLILKQTGQIKFTAAKTIELMLINPDQVMESEEEL